MASWHDDGDRANETVASSTTNYVGDDLNPTGYAQTPVNPRRASGRISGMPVTAEENEKYRKFVSEKAQQIALVGTSDDMRRCLVHQG